MSRLPDGPSGHRRKKSCVLWLFPLRRSGFPTSGSGCRSGRGNSRGLPVSHHLYVPCAGAPGCRPYRIHIRYGSRCRGGSPLTFLPVYGHTQPAYFHSHLSHRINSRASRTHKTPAFRWHPSGFPDCRPKKSP